MIVFWMGKINGLMKKVLIGGMVFFNSWIAHAPETFVEKNPNQFKTIVLDPGHSDYYRGKGYVNEAKYNLKVALNLKEKFEKEGYGVFLTRKDGKNVNDRLRKNGDLNGDGRINLEDEILARNNFSKYYDADLFLSLHFDYVKSDTSSKTQIIYYGLSDKKNLIDRKKNFSKYENLNYFNRESADFARDLSVFYRRKGIKTENYAADLGVLFFNQADKAVLIELDNLYNSRIRKKVETEKGIEEYANNLFECLIGYEREKKGGLNFEDKFVN